MFQINSKLLQDEVNKGDSKQELARDNLTVFDSVKLSFVNLIDTISEFATYNAVHWICNIDRWHRNFGYNNTTCYKRGEIVFLDLGAQNFGHEPSYTHACIVLENRYDSILVVPCSTKQYGTKHTGIIDATSDDGFLKNTGIQSENFRWVSKNRVVADTRKKVSSETLNKLDEVLFSLAPSIRKKFKQQSYIIEKQNEQILSLQEQLDQRNDKNV